MQKHVQLVEKGRLPSSQKRQAILVLGMHRSGTSALGGAINALGVAAPKTILPPNHANPRGFWECAPLVTAHDELLAFGEQSIEREGTLDGEEAFRQRRERRAQEPG